MISKELLLEILKVEVLEIEPNGKNLGFYSHTKISVATSGYTYHSLHNCYIQYINIHELAHKCKEWAYDRGNSLVSWKNTKDSWFVDIRENGNMVVECKKEDNEPSAIFGACQWILDKENK